MGIKRILAIILPVISAMGISATGRADSLINVINRQQAIIDSLSVLAIQAEATAPFAINSLINGELPTEVPFLKMDTADISYKAALAQMLQNSDGRLTKLSHSYRNLIECRKKIDSVCRYMDNEPYNDQTQNTSIAILDEIRREQWLSEIQRVEIDSIAKKLKDYRGAVLRFDNIINSVDEAISEFDDIENSEAISAGEAKIVFEEKNDYIEFIKRYPFLYKIFIGYQDAIISDPKGGSPETKSIISQMVNGAEDIP